MEWQTKESPSRLRPRRRVDHSTTHMRTRPGCMYTTTMMMLMMMMMQVDLPAYPSFFHLAAKLAQAVENECWAAAGASGGFHVA